MNQRTYDECLQRAEQMFDGKRVIVDANFRVDADRVRFCDAAQRMGVRGFSLLTREADAEVVREEIVEATGDASDAGLVGLFEGCRLFGVVQHQGQRRVIMSTPAEAPRSVTSRRFTGLTEQHDVVEFFELGVFSNSPRRAHYVQQSPALFGEVEYLQMIPRASALTTLDFPG
ncbi:MAG: hypothetical protein R3C56_34125 [Pirellulaceae bacterium]